MKKNILLLLSIILTTVLVGQTTLSKVFSPNARIFTMMKSAYRDSSVVMKPILKKANKNNEMYANTIIRLNDADDLDSLEATGTVVNSVIGNFVTALVPIDSLAHLNRISNIARVELAHPVFLRMDKARIAANVDSVQLGNGLSQPYKGKGVVIGDVDEGFQYGHVNFYNAARDTLRVKRVWDQNATTGTNPTDYSYGTEYKTASTILAAGYDTRSEMHATHVVGIAAGADTTNGYQGVAPEADLVFVSYGSTTSDILDGINYIYDYATSVSEPAVVNLSLGSHIGPHDGTSTFDQACDEMQGAGRLLVGAAGNEGSDSLYIHKDFTSATDTLQTLFTYADTTDQVVVSDIWSGTNQNFKIQTGIYDTSTKKFIYKSRFITANTTDTIYYYKANTASTGGTRPGVTQTTSSSIYGYIYVGTEKNSDNNKANAYVVSELNNLSSTQHVFVRIVSTSGYELNAWTESSYCTFNSDKVSGWTVGSSESSVGEIGGTGTKIISVGAFTTKTYFTNLNNVSYTDNGLVTTGDIAYFSSKGPTADGRMKPDIAAPGALITSSYSSALANTSSYSYMCVASTMFNAATYYYGVMEGTSMSTPFVAGVLATWLQADPELTPADVRSVLQETAINDSYTGSVRSSGSNVWGYGKIDAWNGIKYVLNSSGIQSAENDKTTDLFSMSKTSSVFTLTFLQNVGSVVVSVYSLSGAEVYKSKIGDVVQNDESTFDLSGLPQGVYILRVSGENSVSENRKIIL